MADEYMFTHTSRFSSGLAGLSNRFSQSNYESITINQYRQHHEMKHEIPSDVLELFKANQIGFLKAPVKPKCRPLDPVSALNINLMEMFTIPNFDLTQTDKKETKKERKNRISAEKKRMNQQLIRQKIKTWDPFQKQKGTVDPEKTLLVARLNYKTNEKNLKFEFEKYGIIKAAYIVRDLEGNSRGYGFVEFDNKADFVNAYKQANNRKIDGFRVTVDFEKGRTLLNWYPRRFGGGEGQLRLTKEELQAHQKAVKEAIQRRKNRRKRYSRERSRSGKKKDRKKERRNSKDRKEKSNRRYQDFERDNDHMIHE